MIELIRKNLLNIGIAFTYTLLACLVYGIWSYSAWGLWYVTLIIVILITGVGCFIAYLWIKSEIMKNSKKETLEEIKEEKPVE